MSSRYQQERREYFANMRKDEKTANAGFGWSKLEEEKLIEEASEGMSIAEMAENHKRTENSIRARLIDICIRSNDVEEKADELGIDMSDVNTEKERRETYQKKREQYKERQNNFSSSTSSSASSASSSSSISSIMKFKKFLKEKKAMTDKLDSLFDDFISQL